MPNTSTGNFQLQLSGAGIANVTLKPSTQLSVNADTNASFVGVGDYDQVVLIGPASFMLGFRAPPLALGWSLRLCT